jgi:hypothetical protein
MAQLGGLDDLDGVQGGVGQLVEKLLFGDRNKVETRAAQICPMRIDVLLGDRAFGCEIDQQVESRQNGGPAVIGLHKEVLIDKPIIDDHGVNRIFDAEDAERRVRSQDFFIADGR